MSDFPCTQCGQCCRHISSILSHSNYPIVIQDLVNRFPYEVNDDGSCSKLTEDGTCSVYDNRPIMCNVKLMGQLLQQSQDDWYHQQADICNELISNAGLSPDYLVKF